MKIILLGLLSLFFLVEVVGGRRHHHEDKECQFTDEGKTMTFHCKECCGSPGDQYCCDSDDSDEHDGKHGKEHHHKVKVVVVMGSVAVVVFTIVIIGCCVFHKKYKGQQSQKKTAFSGAVTDPSAPSIHPMNTKPPLPADDLYTGQNLTNNDKSKDIAVVGMMMSSPPPYNTKY